MSAEAEVYSTVCGNSPEMQETCILGRFDVAEHSWDGPPIPDARSPEIRLREVLRWTLGGESFSTFLSGSVSNCFGIQLPLSLVFSQNTVSMRKSV